MNINLNQLDAYLLKSLITANFLLVGDDFGQIVYITDKLLKKYFGDEQYYSDTFQYSDLQKDSSPLRNSLQSLQLFSEKKAIVIKGIGDTIKKEILELVKNKSSDYLLIMQGENLRKSSKSYKELESISGLCIISCYKLDLTSMAIFVDKFLTSQNIKCNKELPSIIAQFLPDNILLAQNELEKIVQYLGNEELTLEIVEKIVLGVKDFSCMNLCEAIAFKDKGKMLEQLRRIESEGINFVNIIRMLQNYFARVLYVVKEAHLNGSRVEIIINGLKPPVFFKEKSALVKICDTVNYDYATELMNELIELEISCKFTAFNPDMLLYNYLIQKIQ
jgi:DNA polymerase-3 subunit delta